MNSPASTRSGAGFVRQNWHLIALCALVGFAVAAVLAFVTASSGWRASVDVLITRLAVEDSGADGGSPFAAEVRFANSAIVRDSVRLIDPDSPDHIDVELDTDTNVMTLTAPGDTAEDAERRALEWAFSYIGERREALIKSWAEQRQLIGAELEALVNQLGQARIDGDDAEALRLEDRRNAAFIAEANAIAALQSLDRDPGAELFGQAQPASRARTPLLPMALLGPGLGAMVGLGLAWRRRDTSNDPFGDEDDGWLRRANEGSLTPVLTTRSLDVPSFLAEGAPASLPEVLPEPGAAVVQEVEPGPYVPPLRTVDVPVHPSTEDHLPARPFVPYITGPRSSATNGGTDETPGKNADLRVVELQMHSQRTVRPSMSASDQAWADDISLVTDS